MQVFYHLKSCKLTMCVTANILTPNSKSRRHIVQGANSCKSCDNTEAEVSRRLLVESRPLPLFRLPSNAEEVLP